MSKTFLVVIFLSLAFHVFAQQATIAQPKTSVDYLKKSRRQKLVGHILLWGGFTSIVYGGLKNLGANFAAPNDSKAGLTNVIIGATGMVASVPLFTAARRNRLNAIEIGTNILPQNLQKLYNKSQAQNLQPALVVKLHF